VDRPPVRREALTVRVLLAGAVLLLAGCAPHLRPAPDAQLVPGPGQGAAAEGAGVRVVARAGAWHAWPPHLSSVVVPMLVSVENHSTTAVRLRYQDFALVSPDGRRFPALAPFEIQGVVMEPVPGYARPLGPFLVRDVFGRLVFVDPWFGDPFSRDWTLPRTVAVTLPTADMVQLALPERVVEPGGRVSGFLYFPRLRRVAAVTFTARLLSEPGHEPLATLTIPFLME
jgi:hypothetical protein